YFSIDIEIVNGISEIFINNESKGVSPISLTLEKGTYYITLKRKDYPDQICKVDLFKNHMIKLKHNKDNLLFKEVGIFECGEQPKQVVFSPDDNFIFVPLLDDYGFQIFDVREFRITQFVKPNRANQGGFAEGIFIENRDGKTTFCISQMTTGYIYEYTYPQMELKREIQTGGKWPKYIAYSKTLNLIAVSNWASNNVSIIDYETGKVIKLLETDASPRGIIFTNDGNYLIVLNFDGGTIQKFATKNWKQEKVIFKQNAAMRHIVLNSDNTKAYVSNMYHFEIYEIDVEKFKILKTYKVYYNPNTIDLKDDKLLFVSSRGPNDEESYLKRSPKNGKITVIDVEKQEIINIFEGGNQPTGLDVSNNGKYLCFSNFRDRNIEIYYIGDYQ
ncbi:MAG TPA: beta-propeller fold lactonase family protein, partial [Spirochaetota bacterium]|nr:beta-propeller fold lactonase family protein [Spirochaetota bacterium]